MATQYFCRSCKLPLVIDGSLKDLSPAQQNLMKLDYTEKPNSDTIKSKDIYNGYPIIPAERLERFQDAAKAKNKGLNHIHNDPGLIDIDDNIYDLSQLKSSQNSFVYLHDKKLKDEDDEDSYSRRNNGLQLNDFNNKKTNITERLDTLNNIFDIISSRYEIDYPVCSDCASILISEIENRFESLSKEKEVYMQFLKKLTIQNSPNVEKINKALHDQSKLKDEQNRIMEQLRHEEQKHAELNKEVDDLENEINKLELEERELCVKRNEREMNLEEQLNELDTMKAQYTRNLNTLDILRQTNVFGKIFSVSHEGLIGTINGLRLGCLEDVKVTWPEINAALGQIVLMINTTLKILNISLENYRLLPMGSRSRIEMLSPRGRMINLYANANPLGSSIGGLLGNALGSMFSSPPLSEELLHLDKVVQQLAKHAGYNLPYTNALNWDKWLGWEHWTQQLRLLLGNAHWIFSLAVQQHSPI